ncbi:MAG: class I SAM-dependent methyltransferase [bacterium]
MNPENQLPEQTYIPGYHNIKHHGSIATAEIVLPMLFKLRNITSVIDVGCGSGSWLAVAKQLGAQHLLGVEGEWARSWTKEELPLTEFELITQNLEDRLQINQTFDLLISLEFAEHLPARRADSLIADLCQLSDCILFSAAIPGQGGIRHLNEQWQSIWAERFAVQGLYPIDFVRPEIWANDTLPFWYRQNIVLYMTPAALSKIDEQLRPEFARAENLDVVHPDLFKLNSAIVERIRPLLRWLRSMKKFLTFGH